MDAKVETHPIGVMITTREYEIQGDLHIMAGGYQSRISDLLNRRDNKFIPVTDAVFLSVRNPTSEPRHAETVLVKVDCIEMIVPNAEQEKKVAEEVEKIPASQPHITPKGFG
jgi:tRNA A58 N-methylase Trm61